MSDPTAQQARDSNRKAVIGVLVALAIATACIISFVAWVSSGDDSSEAATSSSTAQPTTDATEGYTIVNEDDETPTAEATTANPEPTPTATKPNRPALPKLLPVPRPTQRNYTASGHIERVSQGNRIIEMGGRINGDKRVTITPTWFSIPQGVRPLLIDETKAGFWLTNPAGAAIKNGGRFTFYDSQIGGPGGTTTVRFRLVSGKDRCLNAFLNAPDHHLEHLPPRCYLNDTFTVKSVRR